MTTTQRNFTVFVPVVALALLSWFTISPGIPKIYAPCNVLVVFPGWLTGSAGGGLVVALMLIPTLYCLWCWPIFRGHTILPIRSIVLLIFAVTLSAAWLLYGYRYGVEYQSTGYVAGVATINLACWALLGVLAVVARRRPSFFHNLGFHAALFAWLAWYAFPYLGELP
jgi:hypothetical protein